MKKIITADQTETFLNEEVGEAYHSFHGAVQEALLKYVVPCKIKELARTGRIVILDVCFGLGYNSAMAISAALEENPACIIEVIGLELDTTIIEKIQEVHPPISCYNYYQQLNSKNLQFQEGNVTVKILLGDGREKVKELPEKYVDAVFFDPFSPKTAPEMWQVPFFQEMFRVMKDAAILATYSCARMARDNMATAGFVYDDGPIFGRRGPGTLATKWV